MPGPEPPVAPGAGVAAAAAAGDPAGPGELSSEDARELRALLSLIHARSGFVCDAYKEKSLRRRLGVRMRARGVRRYAEYAAILAREPAELERCLSTVTINVSKFFRNPEVWEALRRSVVPELFRAGAPDVRVWSAGCAAGEEPYSLAILLIDYAREHGLEDRLTRARILGTDVDAGVLEAARRAEYGELALADVPLALRARWFGPGPRHRVADEARRLVHFERLDLLNGRIPQRQQLILCRNVTIYFEREAQQALFLRLRDALEPGGFLVLGKVETLFGAAAGAFVPVAHRERIFRRP